MQGAPTRSFRQVGGGGCPTCGAAAEEDQLVCLECGSRVALDYRRPPSWRVPAAIVIVVVALAAGAVAFGLSVIGGDAEREVARTPIELGEGQGGEGSQGTGAAGSEDAGEADRQERTEPEKAQQDGAAKKAAKEKADKEKAEREKADKAEPPGPAPAAGANALVLRGDLYSWPRDLRAFTVVLLSGEDRGSAVSFARAAAKGKPAKIGVIRSDDFKTLPKGFFIVFAGRYESRGQADKAAARLGNRFNGAFPQLVQR